MIRQLTYGFWLLAAVVLAPTPLYADDTEIYFARADADNLENEESANVLFLIDTSGSMCDPPRGTRDCENTTTKMYQLKQAFAEVIDGLGEGVRVGVGKFNGGAANFGYGGYVFYPVSDMEEDARNGVKNLVNGLQGTSNTPTMEAYSEMARYMMGYSPSDYAKAGEAESNEPRPAVNITCHGNNCDSASSYESPMNMDNQCESNHIIVMTDGAPTEDTDYNAVNNLTGNVGSCRNRTGDFYGSAAEKRSFACQAELAGWLDDEEANSRRRVQTWQVAFGTGQNSNETRNMEQVARMGGTDTVRYADNAQELAAEFNDILDLIADESQSMISPGVSVNQNNRLEHLDQLYYAVFKPEKESVWPGNLKRYGMDDGQVVDKNDRDAVDEDTGYFREDAWSYWTPTEADGADVDAGGAKNRVETYNDRKIIVGQDSDDGGEYELTQDRVNNQMSNADFGIPNNAANTNYDHKSEVYQALRTLWGDPMHSVPLLVNYEVGDDANDVDGQTNYVFVSTNGGMLHALDTDTGREEFSFMPDEMLKQSYDFVRSPPMKEGNIRSLYGLDASWVSHRTSDDNGDAEKVWIFGGMRRGGSNYYGLDVSDIDDPELEWRIRGPGENGDATTGFERLGQTWSTPTVTRIRIDGEVRTVLVFGGGYDAENHDEEGHRAGKDDVGNAIYIVDAETGEYIWSASSESNSGRPSETVDEMKWSVPGGVAVVDLNTNGIDGIADYLYFADLGGQVFRVNLNNDNDGAPDLVDGVVRLANFGENEHRRFYEAPAVGYVRNGLNETLYVAVGSGYRAHPLDEDTEEGFFLFADRSFKNVQQDDPVEPGDLTEVARGGTPPESDSGNGWWVDFGRSGEKVMSSPTIFQDTVMFTTYVPTEQDQDADPCVVRYGNAYAYRANMITGEPRSFSNDGEASWDGLELGSSSIPPSVVPIFSDDPGDGGGDDGEDGGGGGNGGGDDGGGDGGGSGGGDGDGDGDNNDVNFNVGPLFIGEDGMNYNLFRKRRWYPMEKNDANQYFPRQAEVDQ